MLLLSKQNVYSPIAFDERVTFWLQRARSLPCACVFDALYALRNGYTRTSRENNAASAHSQGSNRTHFTRKLLSRQRQSDYRLGRFILIWQIFFHVETQSHHTSIFHRPISYITHKCSTTKVTVIWSTYEDMLMVTCR